MRVFWFFGYIYINIVGWSSLLLATVLLATLLLASRTLSLGKNVVLRLLPLTGTI